VLCSQPIDDVSQGAPADRVSQQIEIAREYSSAVLVHAHAPGVTISLTALERTLEATVAAGLEFVTFPELVPGRSRPAMALCFDDANIDSWYATRDLLSQYGARVTFFVSRYANWTDAQKGMLAELAAVGHAVEAHTVEHLNAVDYTRSHTIDDYIDREVLPSIAVLSADGYDVSSFAFPYGASTSMLETSVLRHVARVRIGSRSCPY
jgi:peptidoglycan/xylan/chitin deacetylase (PgdA/CDA1 family)